MIQQSIFFNRLINSAREPARVCSIMLTGSVDAVILWPPIGGMTVPSGASPWESLTQSWQGYPAFDDRDKLLTCLLDGFACGPCTWELRDIQKLKEMYDWLTRIME